MVRFLVINGAVAIAIWHTTPPRAPQNPYIEVKAREQYGVSMTVEQGWISHWRERKRQKVKNRKEREKQFDEQ